MQTPDQRIQQLEQRLRFVEQKLGVDAPVHHELSVAASAAVPVRPDAAPPHSVKERAPILSPSRRDFSATHWMAWAAGLTFVLAALYFLKLVYDAGWLTPVRQVAIAYAASLGLLVAGFKLHGRDRLYAAYLPAVGLVVLYLTTFVGHLHYHLWSAGVAVGLAGAITLLGIWLGRRFEHSVYPMFAAVGVYVTPLLVHTPSGTLLDLVIYYSAWSLLFCFCAVQEGRRITYLVPLYLAMLGFDLAYRQADVGAGGAQWALAAVYQLVQFLIFGVTTVVYSVVQHEPVNDANAWPHGVALFIFYALEYALLQRHWPESVNYLALASGGAVFVLYRVARAIYSNDDGLKSSAVLVSYYCAWVAVHALFVGEIEHRWWPWAALFLPMVWAVLLPQLQGNPRAMLPVTLACGLVFALGFGMLLGQGALSAPLNIPLPNAALVVYALALYGMYFYLSDQLARGQPVVALLYAAHLAWLSVLASWAEQGFTASALWALYGVAVLSASIGLRNKVMGQSALMVFVVASLKVLLFDLSGSNSMVRVLALLVISASFYAGGWLYKGLMTKESADAR